MFQVQSLVLEHMFMYLKLRSVALISKLLKDTIFLSKLLKKKDTWLEANFKGYANQCL